MDCISNEPKGVHMKKVLATVLTLMLVCMAIPSMTFAEDCTVSKSNATYGEMTGKTVVGGLLSFLIWPGIGQYMNDEETDKNVTHALLGLTGIFRFWSGWDALVDRNGGYWKGRI